MRKINKKGFEMSFAWLFSILVGAMILFLAIFAATKLIGTSEYEINTKTAADLENILGPIQTSYEDAKSEHIEYVRNTRTFISCNSEVGFFGENIIRLAEEKSFGTGWTEPGARVTTQSQYLFSENVLEGKNLYFIIIPFKMPYKVTDVMSIFSQEHCFVQPPVKIGNELENLKGNLPIEIISSVSNCNENSISVCFQGDCDILVRGNCLNNNCESVYDTGSVFKNGENIQYSKGLMYGAIFASKENYECNVKRIVKKLNIVSEIYIDKSKLMAGRCDTGILLNDLNVLRQISENYRGLNDLQLLEIAAANLDTKNNRLICSLYE